jgi:hypothetical protein
MNAAPFNLPPSSAVERTSEQRADQDELRAALLQEVEERGRPAAIPGPVFLDGPPAPISAPARRPKRPRAPKREPAPVPPPPAPIFDRLALYRPLQGDRAIEPYEMPGGGAVYPHPLSGAERKYVNVQVALNLDRLYAGREAPRTDEEHGQRALERALDAEILGDIWHAVVCGRVAAVAGSERVFQDEDAEAFYRNQGWDEAAQAIAALSRSYAAGRTPLDALREALAPFFAETRTMLLWCASQLDTASSEGTEAPSSVAEARETLRSCASSLAPLTRPSGWGVGDVERLGKGMRK